MCEGNRTTVHVVLYTHTYGTDVYLAHTVEMARKYLENLVKYHRRDPEFHIPEDISDADAAEDWFAFTGGRENMEIVRAGFVEESPEEWHK